MLEGCRVFEQWLVVALHLSIFELRWWNWVQEAPFLTWPWSPEHSDRRRGPYPARPGAGISGLTGYALRQGGDDLRVDVGTENGCAEGRLSTGCHGGCHSESGRCRAGVQTETLNLTPSLPSGLHCARLSSWCTGCGRSGGCPCSPAGRSRARCSFQRGSCSKIIWSC